MIIGKLLEIRDINVEQKVDCRNHKLCTKHDEVW